MLAGPPIVLKLLGKPQLLVDGRVIRELPKKTFVLLAMLLLKAKNETPRGTRDDISAFLWPEATSGSRGSNLRALVSRLRDALDGLPNSPLRIDEQSIALVMESCFCDLIELRALLSCGDPQAMGAAALLMNEALLEGCETGVATHRAWIAARRESLSLEFARKAARALKSRLLIGNARLRETLEQKILDVRPIDEEAQLALAKLIKGRCAAKSASKVCPPNSAAGHAAMPLSRKD